MLNARHSWIFLGIGEIGEVGTLLVMGEVFSLPKPKIVMHSLLCCIEKKTDVQIQGVAQDFAFIQSMRYKSRLHCSV